LNNTSLNTLRSLEELEMNHDENENTEPIALPGKVKLSFMGHKAKSGTSRSLGQEPKLRLRSQGSKEAAVKSVRVECRWYVEAHNAPVTSLLVCSSDVVLSGCEASHPKACENENPLKAWNASSGELLGSFEGPALLASSIAFIPEDDRVMCAFAECASGIWSFESKERVGFHEFRERNTNEREEESTSLLVADGSEAKFMPESGFRGNRKGYVFRKGEWGTGYYRKDTLMGVVTFPISDPADVTDSQLIRREKEKRALQRKQLQKYMQASNRAHTAVVSKSSKHIYCGSIGVNDSDIKVHEALGGKVEKVLTGHTKSVLCLLADGDDRYLYSGSYDQTIIMWDIRSGKAFKTFKGHTSGVHALALSGDILYSASSDNSIRAWNLKSGMCQKTFFGQHHPGTWPVSLTVSPDGSRLASGSKGPFGATSIKIWSACGGHNRGNAGGKCLVTFAQLGYAEGGCISSLSFNDDGSILYTGASDGTIAAWDVISKSCDASAVVNKGFLL